MIDQIFKRAEGYELKNILDYAKSRQLFKAKEAFTLSQLAFFFLGNLLKT